jgi:hypothetical protein
MVLSPEQAYKIGELEMKIGKVMGIVAVALGVVYGNPYVALAGIIPGGYLHLRGLSWKVGANKAEIMKSRIRY